MTDRRTQPDTTTDRPILRQVHNDLFLVTCYERVELKKKNLRKDKLKNNHRKLLNVSMQLGGGVQDELRYELQMEYEQEFNICS